MLARPAVFMNGALGRAPAGVQELCQAAPIANATAAGVTLTAAEIVSGWIQRSNGGGAGYTDVFPPATDIIALLPDAAVGDCFELYYQNTVAFLMTFGATPTGIVAGVGTLNVAASTTRLYRFTLLSTKPTVILVGNNTNANKIYTGFTAAQLANVMPGMGVSGTGVGASAVVVGVTPGDGTTDVTTGGKITVDVNSTSTNSNIAFTFFPRIRIDALGTLAA